MNVVAFTGYSGAGKTTLIEGVIAALAARGLRVATVKHAHQGFDLDRPGKDSWRHREAGAREVLVASARRVALLRELAPPARAGADMALPPADADAGAAPPSASVATTPPTPSDEDDAPPPLASLLAMLDPATDWALVEGFRGAGDVPKIEVWRAAAPGEPPRAAHYPYDGAICAVATDRPTALPAPPAVPVLDLNAPDAVAHWLVEQSGRFAWLARGE